MCLFYSLYKFYLKRFSTQKNSATYIFEVRYFT